MTQQPHPDSLLHQHAVKAITRGSRQFADDKAMDAYWLAMEEGKNIAEAGKVFNDTYKKMVDGK